MKKKINEKTIKEKIKKTIKEKIKKIINKKAIKEEIKGTKLHFFLK